VHCLGLDEKGAYLTIIMVNPGGDEENQEDYTFAVRPTKNNRKISKI